MIDVVGVPYDRCGRRRGSALGPAAMRQAGLREGLGDLGLSVRDLGDLPIPYLEDDATPGLRHFESAYGMYEHLRTRVADSLAEGRVPLVVGGGHSLSIGSISGALAAHGEGLGVLWIDAHADVNVPATTPSGNLHGMPLGALMGRPSGVSDVRDQQWSMILNGIVPPTRLRDDHLGWIALRDVDRGEREAIESLHRCFATTMQDIDRRGVERVVRATDHWLRATGVTHLWVSFDVDALDPVFAPGTGTAVRGGLTYREAHLIAELLREMLDAPGCPYRLAGLDVVEVNPLCDTQNETARVAVEWILSLFGKTILGKYHADVF